MLPGNYPDPDIPVDDAWAQMKTMLDSAPGKPGSHSPATAVVKKMIFYGGAVLVAASTIIYFSVGHKIPKSQTVVEPFTSTGIPAANSDTSQEIAHGGSHIYTSRQIPQKYTLPNGATLFLDRNSLVSVQQDEANNMFITVRGGAYFDDTDAHGRKQGNTNIQAGQINILPHQANFYVSYDSLYGVSSAQVQSGTAEITAGNTTTPLIAGESLRFNEKTKRFSKQAKADVNIFSYATHVFEFNDTPLKDAAAYIEKAYGVKIRLIDPELSNYKITTRFDNKSLNEMLDIMAYTLNFEYSLDKIKNEILIKTANGRK